MSNGFLRPASPIFGSEWWSRAKAVGKRADLLIPLWLEVCQENLKKSIVSLATEVEFRAGLKEDGHICPYSHHSVVRLSALISQPNILITWGNV